MDNPMIQTADAELLTPSEMLSLVKDWAGGCEVNPGNTDILRVLLELGVEKERMVLLTEAINRGAWAKRAVAAMVVELLGSSRVRAAVARHGHLTHGLGRLEARRDVRALYAEAREMLQREVLLTVGKGVAVTHHERRVAL